MSDPYSEEHCRAFRKYQGNDCHLDGLSEEDLKALAAEDVNFASEIRQWRKRQAKAAPTAVDGLRFAGAWAPQGYAGGSVVYHADALWLAAVPTSSPPSLDGGWEIVCKAGQML